MRKQGKRARYDAAVKAIMTQDKPCDVLWQEYQEFLRTQTILKRPPKKGKPWKWVIHHLCDTYMAHAAKPFSEYEYVECFFAILHHWRDLWNDEYKLPRIADYQIVHQMTAQERRLKKHFAKANPEMAEADAVFQAILALKRGGIENQQLEQRFDELTHGWDPLIIASLPTVIRAMELKESLMAT